MKSTEKIQTVYLDLNHFINLSKKIRESNNDHFDKLVGISKNRKAVFPITSTHLLEICAIRNNKQRQILADIIKAISNGMIFRPLDTIMYVEIFNRVANHFGYKNLIKNEQEVVLSHGFSNALGELNIDFSPWRQAEPVKSRLAEKEVFSILNDNSILNLLVSLYFPKAVKGKSEHPEIADAAKHDPQVSSENYVLALRNTFIKLVLNACDEIGINEGDMAKNPPTHFWTKEYMITIPTINVFSALQFLLYKDPNRKVTLNHLYDTAHLAVAIPYANIVVADKEMAHIVKSGKLDEQYNTNVFSRLEELIDYLDSLNDL